MANAFFSEISLFGFNFAPVDWAACDGQLLPTNQNEALFSLLGTAFGGNGTSNFALPQLQGRVPVSSGTVVDDYPRTYTRGQIGGSQYVTLSKSNLPAHRHNFYATSETGNFGANYPQDMQIAVNEAGTPPLYTNATSLTPLNDAAISSTGGGQSHYNVQPYQVVLFCICTNGIYPSRN